ncbi:unnamed protein product, partial [marine sediment metagenome]
LPNTLGVHMAQVSHVAKERATVFLVTGGISPTDVEKLGLNYAATPREALNNAFDIVGRDAKVAVLRGAAEMLPIIEKSA